MIADTMITGEIAPNVTTAVITRIPISDVLVPSRRVYACEAQRIYVGVTVGTAACGPRGSPFQIADEVS